MRSTPRLLHRAEFLSVLERYVKKRIKEEHQQKLKRVIKVVLCVLGFFLLAHAVLFCYLYFWPILSVKTTRRLADRLHLSEKGRASLLYYTGHLVDDRGKLLDLDKIAKGDFKQESLVYAADGKTIIGRFFEEPRDLIKEGEIPDILAKAFVAAEDKRFYSWQQFGIDPWATTRAGFINFGNKTLGKLPGMNLFFNYFQQKDQGGSGIDQQLARLLYADDLNIFKTRERTLRRKRVEARAAVQLFKRHSRQTNLAAFLNSIYFGRGAYGVAEATRRFFNKEIRQDKLTLREAAVLASLNKSPAKYSPIYRQFTLPKIPENANPEEVNKITKAFFAETSSEGFRIQLAIDRYNWVLKQMLKNNFISQEEYDSARFSGNLQEIDDLLHTTPIKNQDFGYGDRFVKETLLTNGFPDEEINRTGGLKILTGYDPKIQRIVTEELATYLSMLNGEFGPGEERLEGAIVVIDNKTGRVLAQAGGHNYQDTPFDRSLAVRSPGSGAKPMVYATAFELFAKTFDDYICNCPFRMRGANGRPWVPRNFQEKNPVRMGRIPLPVGLIRSVNLATLNLAREIGIDSIIGTYHKLGIWGEAGRIKDSDGKVLFRRPWVGEEYDRGPGGLVPQLPTAIGASDVSLLEITCGFSVFARGGIYIRPSVILEIKDFEGNLLYQARPIEPKQVLSKKTADKITILLRAVTKIGTAQISMNGISQEMAVKTGTSNGPKDIQVYGYNPEITMGIRIGYDSSKIIYLPQYMKRASGDASMHVSGGWVVGPLYRRIIERIYQDRPKVFFPQNIEDGLAELLVKLGNK